MSGMSELNKVPGGEREVQMSVDAAVSSLKKSSIIGHRSSSKVNSQQLGHGSRSKSMGKGSTVVDLDEFVRQHLAHMPPTKFVVKLQAARERSQSSIGFIRRTFVIILSSIIFIVVNTILMAVPISKVVMGSVFFHDCPAEPLIALYLLVDGGVAVARDLWGLLMWLWLTEDQYERYEKNVSAVAFLIILLEMAWFIGGSVFVYRTRPVFQAESKIRDSYCHYGFYWYAFWMVTVTYCLWATVVLSFLIACCLGVSDQETAVKEDSCFVCEGEGGIEIFEFKLTRSADRQSQDPTCGMR